MAPPQTRSLRSKKRTCPTDESSQEVQGDPLQKDGEGDIKEADNTDLGDQQTDLQESAAVPNIQHEGEERSSLSKADEYDSEEVDATDVGNNGKEETTVCDSRDRFDLETSCEQTNDSNNGNETVSEECRRSPGQPEMFVPAAEDDRKPSCAVLEKQLERSNLKRSQDTNDDKPSCGTADIKESAAGLPVKKKRRMGMCGLTEKERSHFLQAQQQEGVENGAGSAGRTVCDETAEPPASEDDVSPNHLQSAPPHASADVREEREEKPQPDDHQAETEVHCSVTDTDGTGTTSNPGCSEERDSEAKDGSLTDPEQNGNTEPIQLAQEGEEKHLENLQPPEVKDHSAGNVPEIQTKPEEDLSPREQTNSLHVFTAKQQEESDADAAQPQTCGANGTTDESKPEVTDGNDGKGGASSAATQSAELNCEASLTPTAQEMSNSYDPNDDDDAAGPSVVHTERAPTRSPENSSGSGVLDYVSDSQLNTIVLIEETKEGPDPSGHLEDATELICGLMKELSSLNRKVMVAHRELENLRRKPSRSSIR